MVDVRRGDRTDSWDDDDDEKRKKDFFIDIIPKLGRGLEGEIRARKKVTLE